MMTSPPPTNYFLFESVPCPEVEDAEGKLIFSKTKADVNSNRGIMVQVWACPKCH